MSFVCQGKQYRQSIKTRDKKVAQRIYDLAKGEIRNLTRKRTFIAQAIPPFMQELISDGGLIKHIAKRLKENP